MELLGVIYPQVDMDFYKDMVSLFENSAVKLERN